MTHKRKGNNLPAGIKPGSGSSFSPQLLSSLCSVTPFTGCEAAPVNATKLLPMAPPALAGWQPGTGTSYGYEEKQETKTWQRTGSASSQSFAIFVQWSIASPLTTEGSLQRGKHKNKDQPRLVFFYQIGFLLLFFLFPFIL